ncbi:hypothetical protein ACFV97_13835 [Streptomyces sp. NPDC059913]|uniref:hypothetical protein n=1 Tax=unclassified Streptomyces TaxID=2593676 RepID=UPI00364CED97
MLSYLASSLPLPTSAAARLLALQCALRSNLLGYADLPAGLIRGMALGCATTRWKELEAARWLRLISHAGQGRVIRLTDPLVGLPGARSRSRAADWALRMARGRNLAGMPAESRLVALALLAHTRTHAGGGTADAHQVGRTCSVSVSRLLEEVRRLTERKVFTAWMLDPRTDDLSWDLSDSSI